MDTRLGIVFTGGAAPSPEQCRALLEEAAAECRFAPGSQAMAAQGSPLVVAADSGLLAAERAGIRPSLIIGDMDSLDTGRRLAAYRPEQVLRYPADKDYTDTELAFSLLREKGCGRIWIIGGGGGRTDHLFAIRSLFEREKPPERWITGREDIRCIESPGALRYTEEGNLGPPEPRRGFLISVFPLGPGPWKAASKGLKWPLTGLVWGRGFFGLSNEAPDGSFTIYAEKGRFMVILPL
ncbi:MAG: thiamine diphosphokinase [Treponema sp.]|jgi:thiamine pyrophosphokinase|nr:thiamine diphosphokinase [Treponema sp.]